MPKLITKYFCENCSQEFDDFLECEDHEENCHLDDEQHEIDIYCRAKNCKSCENLSTRHEDIKFKYAKKTVFFFDCPKILDLSNFWSYGNCDHWERKNNLTLLDIQKWDNL